MDVRLIYEKCCEKFKECRLEHEKVEERYKELVAQVNQANKSKLLYMYMYIV